MRLQVLSLTGTLFEGDTDSVTLPTKKGEITVLKNHIPLITILEKGTIKTHERQIPVTGGFAQISRSKVTVLVK